jgi:poly-beta-1,6-N-acetyl-D-glucosamine synthase
VSPVRNEAAHIERVVRAMAAQTRPPDRWVVVDDGSTDGTLGKLRALEREVGFMTVEQAPADELAGGARDRLARAAAPRTFNAGLRSVSWQEYTHVGKLDGDVELPASYYEEILDQFAADPRLGIACGELVEHRDGRRHLVHKAPHHVHGALKTYSIECFRSIGGIREMLGWDTVDETYARMHGYRTGSVSSLEAIHHRPVGSADGFLRGRARHGECAYIAHYGLVWVALRSLRMAGTRPVVFSGGAFLFGYLRAAARRVPRVEDPTFRRYARRELRQRMRVVLRISPPRKFSRGRAV